MILSFLILFLLLYLIYEAFIKKSPGWFTRHMFSYYSLIDAQLVTKEGYVCNVWDYFPHTQLYCPPKEFVNFLAFLSVKGIFVSGRVMFIDNGQKIVALIKNNTIV